MNINKSLRAKKLNSYRGDQRPHVLGIVLHDTAGSGTVGDAKYLANDPENRGVSVDYCILRDGEIYQLNPDLTKYSTNHAGRNTAFKGRRNADVNAITVGIELAHKADPRKQLPIWPDEQIKAVAELCVDLCDRFKLTKDDITTHSRIIRDGSRSDPREFPWALFWGYFGHENLPVPDENTMMVTDHIVKKGDTLWGLAKLYHTTIENLKRLNNLENTTTISVGQIIKIKEANTDGK